ncbi:MAG: DegT/DnrJ/EryC1/StrS family aminotransferase [Thaumarchaeota archaeon]|nr:DegT/DnrJ/EryC1/StrS family aminotransferase [Nitrososphaerota archaeon]
MEFLPINLPNIGEAEKRAVERVVESGRLTDSSYGGGPMVREFESKAGKLLKAKHVIAVNSGTAALHSVLLALGIKEGDEVVLPSFTFVATANVVLACGARPVFVDIKEDYNIDPGKFKRAVTSRTRAVIPVHIYGFPADMDEVRETAAPRSIHVIEDAAESLGAEYKGRQTGTLSDAGCFSLYGTKVATSGEGGAISTQSDELADRLRLVRNHGMLHGYDSRHLGFNYRLPELGAAVASVQMDRLSGFLKSRRRNAAALNGSLGRVDGARFTQVSDDRTHVFYLYTLYLRKGRDRIMKRLNAAGIGAAVYFKTPVHKTPLYQRLGYSKKSLGRTEASSSHVLSLPVHPRLTSEDMGRISDEFIKAAKGIL